MPFTFSHPVIVLPLHALPLNWRSMTGLVIGSMVPDFEMFLKMKAETSFSHTLGGIFWFNLPLAVLLSFVFHHIVRNALILNLPAFLRIRLSSFLDFNWAAYFKKHFLIVVLSILFGAALHIIWDGFTHRYGYFVKQLPVLLSEVQLSEWAVPLYQVFQYGFSVLGGIGILYAILRLPAQQEMPKRQISFAYWLLILVITLPIFYLGMQQEILRHYFANVLVILISAGSVALILTPLILKWYAKVKPAVE